MTSCRPATPLAERFWPKVDRRGPDDCWLWLGYRLPEGYGVIRITGNRKMVATRVSLTLAGRPRPSDRHEACHSCDNPPCVNPAHLWWGTRNDNMQDSLKKGRHAQASRTECFRGHPLTEDNIMLNHVGARLCRQCSRIRGRRQREKHTNDIAALSDEDGVRVEIAADKRREAIRAAQAKAKAGSKESVE